jgi:hypothetical protein
MKDRPILFSAPMVRAILAGTKTQTRRVAKGVHIVHEHTGEALAQLDSAGPRIPCPYGQPGDRLWVREAHLIVGGADSKNPRVVYAATNDGPDAWLSPVWRPSIHMPRWASRITLEITSVRVERLQAISEADARAEGVEYDPGEGGTFHVSGLGHCCSDSAADSFRKLWESINGAESWGANPWVWAITFKRIESTT